MKSLAEKMQVKPGDKVLVLNPPEGWTWRFGPADDQAEPGRLYDHILSFVRQEGEIRAGLPAWKVIRQGEALWHGQRPKSWGLIQIGYGGQGGLPQGLWRA